jgi:uncharacterized protein HemX
MPREEDSVEEPRPDVAQERRAARRDEPTRRERPRKDTPPDRPSDPSIRVPMSTMRALVVALLTAIGGGAFGGMLGVASKEDVQHATQQAAEAREAAREAKNAATELRVVVGRLEEAASALKETVTDLKHDVASLRRHTGP